MRRSVFALRILGTFAVLVMALAMSCSFGGRKLSDGDIDHYVSACAKLQELGPSFATPDGASALKSGQEGFAEVEATVKSAGFADFREFVEVSTAIGLAVSVIEGKKSVETYEAAAKDIRSALTPEMLASFDSFMNDPANTDEAKAAFEEQLRASLAEAQGAYNAEYAKNAPSAKAVLGFAEKQAIPENLVLVERRLPEILSAMAGQRP